MASFLELVNKVVLESGSEMDSLSLATWDSAEAGRRNYPRFKRNVADAWKMIQMGRLEWEFNDVAVNTIVYPRIKIADGNRATAPAVGSVFEGIESGFRFTVSRIFTSAGSWEDGDAGAQLEFTSYETGKSPRLGESFKEVSPVPSFNSFTYVGRGSYDFKEINPLLREPMWNTVVTQVENGSVIPAVYIPWSNWLYKEADYMTTGTVGPSFVSQDYEGKMVFYPQSLRPFRINYVSSTAPQILTDPEDVPAVIPEEFHDWIAWEALDSMAFFDKNPDLQAYANKWTRFYRIRAERQLLPTPQWSASRYNSIGIE
ncbi:head to tail adaptor [Xanthomonas phage DES1]|nr:head to tail adaptor [Xanthomonas phage DES1]